MTTNWDETIEGPLAMKRTDERLYGGIFDPPQVGWDRMAEEHPTVEDADPK